MMGEEIDRCKYIHKHILVYIYIYTDKKRYTRIKKIVVVFVFVDIFIIDYKKIK